MYKQESGFMRMVRGLSPSVRFLLILNIAIYFIDSLTSPVPEQRFLTQLFALHANWWTTLGFGQLFTYMFVHGSLTHLLMNMMGLFFIGPTLERTLGAYRFFILYYVSGIIGGLGWSLLANPYAQCVGASGALMGILGAFAALYPNEKVSLIFLPTVPFKAWKFVLAIMLFEFFQTFVHPVFGGIANAAHLMGGVAGFSYAMSIKYPHLMDDLKNRIPFLANKVGSRAKPKAGPRPDQLSKEEIDAILDKIGKEGMGALSPREREMLKRATRG